MATRNVVPRANEEGNIGTSLKNWLKGWFKNLFISGEITDGNSGVAVTVLDLDDAVDKKHSSYLLGSKNLDEATIADGKVLTYKSSSGKIEYETPSTVGDMLKSTYDTDIDGIVDKAETVDDGVGNTSTAIDVKDAVTKKHNHINKIELDLVTDGDHDVIFSGNPHSVSKSDVGLGNVDNLQQIPLTQKGSANGVAELGADSKVPTSQLPALAITDIYTAVSEVTQLALTVQKGDVCVRTDENKSYIALNSDNVGMGDWQELLTPTDSVLSVNGKTGAVTLDSDDITEGVSNLYLTGNEFQKTTDDLDDITDGSTYKKSHNDFTDTLKSKLDGIASLAEVNVNADWDASSGDAQILNKPDLSDLHNHTNKTLLDTYDQTNADIIDVISKEHVHGNLTLLETYTQIEADLASAVSLKHSNSLDHTQNSDTDLDATFEATFMKKVDNVNALADITSPGANIEDAVTKRHSHQFSCNATRSTTLSIPNTTFTYVILNAEVFDVGNMHDLVTNTSRITIPAGGDGTYIILAMVTFDSNATGYRRLQIRKNGVTIANERKRAVSGTATALNVQMLEQMVAGDYVQMRVYQNSGGAINLFSGQEDISFSAHKVA